MNDTDKISLVDQLLKRRIETPYPSEKEVSERLSGSIPLTIYLGIDPTGPDVHLGHTVPLLVMRDIAELGHNVVLLIGDFTARIGDPTGKGDARTALTEDQVQENMATYFEQVQKIIPKELFSIAYNSEWLSTLSFEEILKLTGMVTVQQMIQRDMFQERLKSEKPIHMSEFLYPLMQGYDSVALRADGEVGGRDQTFNMLMGRTLAQNILGKDKIVLTTRLITDSAGKKMGKTEGNVVALNDSPQEIRRKILATVSDDMVRMVFELCTRKEQTWINEVCEDPRKAKEELAVELIRMYHGDSAVDQASVATEIEATGPLLQTLQASGAVSSISSGKRLIDQKGVVVNGEVVDRWDLEVKSGDEIKVGKGKFMKVK